MRHISNVPDWFLMRFRGKLLMKLGGLAIAEVTRHWMGTLDYQTAFYDPTVDPVHASFRGPMIYLFWHEYIPFPFYLRGRCNIAMLLSQHQDAEWLSQAAKLMGFATVRGSTNRGGVAALRELFRTGRNMNLTITPDGPRGPRRELALGPVYLSSRLGIPLVPFGIGYDRPWRNSRSWDRFAVPRPYSRARAVVGPPLQIPQGLRRDALEITRRTVQNLLSRLTSEAEGWAESGARLDSQLPIVRAGIPWWRQQVEAA